MEARRLCRAEELAEGAPRGFDFEEGGRRFGVLVIRRGSQVLAYENSCPHAGTPLDLMPDRFLSADGRHLQCHTHGALFRIGDGMCVAGPCLGRALRPVGLRVEAGWLLLDLPD